MNTKYKFIVLIVVIIVLIRSFQYYQTKEDAAQFQREILSNQKLKVSVYYEALCPDSKFFITHQLQPAFEYLKDFVELDLIPYGKAQTIETNGKYIFHCQHGDLECTANKVHACVRHYVKDSLQQLNYVSCMIQDNMIPDDAGEKCGSELNIDSTPILDCSKDLMGAQLLAIHGKRTHSLSPTVSFIPTIAFNDRQNLVPQNAILKDFVKSVCQVLISKPAECIKF